MPVAVAAFERAGDFDLFFALGELGGGVVWRPVLAGADFLLADEDPQLRGFDCTRRYTES